MWPKKEKYILRPSGPKHFPATNQGSSNCSDTNYWNSVDAKNYSFHWIESLYPTVWQGALMICIIAILLKLQWWMLSMHTTKIDCASLQQFSRSDDNASSYARHIFFSSLDK
jgi:hypothetical protein